MGRLPQLAGLLVVAGMVTAFLIYIMGQGATEFRVEAGGTRVHIDGPITGAGTERFQRILEQNPNLTTVALGNMPGTSDANWLLAIGYLIRDAGLRTEVVGVVWNDAILLMLGGAERRIGREGALIVTDSIAAAQTGIPFDRTEVALAERAAYVTDMLGSDDFAIYMEDLRDAGGRVTLDADTIDRFGLIRSE